MRVIILCGRGLPMHWRGLASLTPVKNRLYAKQNMPVVFSFWDPSAAVALRGACGRSVDGVRVCAVGLCTVRWRRACVCGRSVYGPLTACVCVRSVCVRSVDGVRVCAVGLCTVRWRRACVCAVDLCTVRWRRACVCGRSAGEVGPPSVLGERRPPELRDPAPLPRSHGHQQAVPGVWHDVRHSLHQGTLWVSDRVSAAL